MKQWRLALGPAVIGAVLAYGHAGAAWSCVQIERWGASVPIDRVDDADGDALWGSPPEVTQAPPDGVWWTTDRSVPLGDLSPRDGNTSAVDLPTTIHTDGVSTAVRVPDDAAPGDAWQSSSGTLLTVIEGEVSRDESADGALRLSGQKVVEVDQPDDWCAVVAPLYRTLELHSRFLFPGGERFLYDVWVSADPTTEGPGDAPPGGSLLSAETFPDPFVVRDAGTFVLWVSPLDRFTGERGRLVSFTLGNEFEKVQVGTYHGPGCDVVGAGGASWLAITLLIGLFVRRRTRGGSSE